MSDGLFRVFSGIPRQGPGSETSTRKAIGMLPVLPKNPRILDLGCGTGAQTGVLAKELGGRITAVDIHQPYLDELSERLPGVETRCASMEALDCPEESVDLIWSEGAVYLVGVERALTLWRPLLKAGGAVAFSEISWLRGDRPEALDEYWRGLYPPMGDAQTNCERARRAGYEVVGHFALPPEDWLRDFYVPLQKRCEALRDSAGEELLAVIEETQEEIAMFDRYSAFYSYIFYVVRK